MTWKRGQSGNPNGRKRSPARTLVEAAIKAEGKKRGKTLWEHLVERAYTDDAVLVALARKFLPDLRSVDAKIDSLPFRLVLTNGHNPTTSGEESEDDDSHVDR